LAARVLLYPAAEEAEVEVVEVEVEDCHPAPPILPGM